MVELNVNYDELEEMDLEKAKKIISNFSKDEFIEDVEYEDNGVRYGVKIIDKGSWDDQGKYQFREDIGVLCEYNDNYNIVKLFDIAITQSMSRTGSYYSDYYYEYNELEVKKIIKKVIPRQVIEERTIAILE